MKTEKGCWWETFSPTSHTGGRAQPAASATAFSPGCALCLGSAPLSEHHWEETSQSRILGWRSSLTFMTSFQGWKRQPWTRLLWEKRSCRLLCFPCRPSWPNSYLCFLRLGMRLILLLHQNNHNRYTRNFPGGTVVKNPPANAGDTGSSPGPGRSHMPRSN